ncbi:MAG: glycosyltransferase family 2 protein [Candidatus Sulfotelmatobacter sp.]|jgi:glycosyltransferase involved in cell wall biosynthesis
MLKDALNSTPKLLFSVVIAVCNDWGPLEQCLRSLHEQTNPPGFEVIVADDGSAETAPESIRRWNGSYPLTVVRQPHAGIAAARNLGLRSASGSVFLFTDADCRLQTNCLAALATALKDLPQHSYFQLRLTGDRSNLVGRAEELRLIALQNQKLRPDGCIRYLNSAGFAIRRAKVNIEAGLFDPMALRAEDTLLMAELIQRGDLPFFVADAIVQHSISISLSQCLRKDVRSAWLEGETFQLIAARGVQVRMSQKERLTMLLSMWKTARERSIGRDAWFVLVTRQLLQRIVTLSYRILKIRGNTHLPTNAG